MIDANNRIIDTFFRFINIFCFVIINVVVLFQLLIIIIMRSSSSSITQAPICVRADRRGHRKGEGII